MVIEKLISDLQVIQATHPGIDVVILNWEENLSGDSGDGSSSGVYPDFRPSLEELTSQEDIEYYKERFDKDYKPWVSLSFSSDDRYDDGTLID